MSIDFTLGVAIYSAIASLFSLSVIATLLIFSEMRNKRFFQCILWMAVGELGTSVVSMFGFPRSDSPLCWIQGIGVIYFPLVSWMWTTVLSFSIFAVVWYEKQFLSIRTWHLICWTLPLFPSLLPIITNNFGAPSVDLQWCLLVDRSNSPRFALEFWTFASFFGWFFLMVALMGVWTVMIFYRIVWQQTAGTVIIRQTYSKLWWYPIAMVGCWTLNFIISQNLNDRFSSPLLVWLSMMFGISNGILSAIIFFVKSQEARSRWHFYLYGVESKKVPERDVSRMDPSVYQTETRNSRLLDRPSQSTIVRDFDDFEDEDGEPLPRFSSVFNSIGGGRGDSGITQNSTRDGSQSVRESEMVGSTKVIRLSI